MEPLTLEAAQVQRIINGFIRFRNQNKTPILSAADFCSFSGFKVKIETPTSCGDSDNVKCANGESCYQELEKIHGFFGFNALERSIKLQKCERMIEQHIIDISGVVKQLYDTEGKPGMFTLKIKLVLSRSDEILIQKFALNTTWPECFNMKKFNAPHPEGTITCEYCSETVPRSYQHHIKKHHPEKYEEHMNGAPSIRIKQEPDCETSKVSCLERNKEVGKRWMKRHTSNSQGHPNLKEQNPVVHPLENSNQKIDETNLIKEVVDETGQRIIICAICNERLPSKNQTGSHLVSAHLDDYEQLKSCDVVANMAKPLWRCGECSETFNTDELYYAHPHSKPKYKCSQPNCFKLFSGFNTLRFHHRRDHPYKELRNPLLHEGELKCTHCELIFIQKSQLNEHVKTLHPDYFWFCPHCESICDTKQWLETHLTECRKNPDKYANPQKVKVEVDCRNKKTRKRRTERNEEMVCKIKVEVKSDDGGDEDPPLCESLDETGTQWPSCIKTRKIPKKIKVTTKHEDNHTDKLIKNVKVLLVRLTEEEIELYTFRK